VCSAIAEYKLALLKAEGLSFIFEAPGKPVAANNSFKPSKVIG
jgi:hypothetical protein